MTPPTARQTDLLGLALDILDGRIPVPGGRAPRAAAVVARQALEEAIGLRCATLANFVHRPTTRCQLILLRHDDPEIGRFAQIAWDGLSRACHHHACELQPTVGEVRSLIRLVQRVADERPAVPDQRATQVPA